MNDNECISNTIHQRESDKNKALRLLDILNNKERVKSLLISNTKYKQSHNGYAISDVTNVLSRDISIISAPNNWITIYK